MALAAVLALCAVGLTTSELLQLRDGDLPEVGRHQRGGSQADGLTVVSTAGGIQLAWSEAPMADTIVYVFMSADMAEVGRRTAPGALQLVTDDSLAAASYCQAFAVLQGDTVGRSSITSLATTGE